MVQLRTIEKRATVSSVDPKFYTRALSKNPIMPSVGNVPESRAGPTRHLAKRLSFFRIPSLYPPVYPPMALTLSFDRVFENPFLRQTSCAAFDVPAHLRGRYIYLAHPHPHTHTHPHTPRARGTYLPRICARVRAHILEYEEL